ARIDGRRRLLAGMTGGAVLGENPLAAGHDCLIARDEFFAAGCVGQMKRLELTEKGRDVTDSLLGRPPENRVLLRIRRFERLLWSETDQPIVTCHPVFRKHADVYVNAKCRARNTDRIRAVL